MEQSLQATQGKPTGSLPKESTTSTPKQTRRKQTRKKQTRKIYSQQASPQEQNTQQGNIISRLRDRALNPNTAKWESSASYRISNQTKENIPLTGDKNVLLETIDANSAKTVSGEKLQKVNQEILNRYIGENKISYKLLEYKENNEYIISNLTAKRISIKHNYFPMSLFLPAFGSRTIKGKTLLEHSYTDWENQGLIKIEIASTPSEDQTAYAVLGLLIILLGLFLLVSIPIAIFFQSISWKTIGIVTGVGVVLMTLSLAMAGQNLRKPIVSLLGWLRLLPGIVLVLATGVGLPVLIVYLFGDGKNLLETQVIELASLGRIMQVAFISIASMLPAFLFYLFGRQQVEKQKENFYREAMLLDPNVWSDGEAKNKYDPLLNSVFDTGNSPFSVLLLLISTALLVMGWIITLSPIGSTHGELTNLIDFFIPVTTPFTFGFLGAYFFTVNMIYRRYVRADLTTKTYAYITMRLLVTLVLVWTVSTLPQFRTGSALETGLFVVAFIIGIFPETGMALIQDQFRLFTKRAQEKDNFSLTELEGMNLYDRARLLEEGIENIENLAHHNLMELIARTRIPTPRLVDMFDQAILYLHLGAEMDKDREQERQTQDSESGKEDPRNLLKSLGVRTATDLIKCKDEIYAIKDNENYKSLISKLEIIVTALKDDEWLNYVQNWRSYSSSQEEPIDNPFKFYETATNVQQSWKKYRRKSWLSNTRAG